MRLCRLLMLLAAVAALSACARQARPYYYAASPPYAAPQRYAPPSPRSDLDTMMYGTPATYRAPPAAAYRPVYGPPVYRPPAKGYARPARMVPAPPIEGGTYTLDTGDKLRIVVFGQDTLSNTYTVDAAGQVTMPLIGAVAARDLTTAALSAAIKARLTQGFIREPSVAVEVETYRPFFVLGEVTHPGQYPYVPRMTVENAVAIAGGFTPRASKDKVAVTRKIQGTPAKFALPLQYPLKPGDVVTVAERWF